MEHELIELLDEQYQPSVLSENEQVLADAWRRDLRLRGLLPPHGSTLESLGVPMSTDPVVQELAGARDLLASSWGCVRSIQELNQITAEDAALCALSMYLDKLGCDIELLWAIELAEVTGNMVSNDEDQRRHHVNHEKYAEAVPGRLLDDPISSDFDDEFDGEVTGNGLSRGDGLVTNVQLQDAPIGKSSDFWALGLASIWNPKENKKYSFWKPVGLLKRTIMDLLRTIAEKLEVGAFEKVNKTNLKVHINRPNAKDHTLVIQLYTYPKPTSPVKFSIPAKELARLAYQRDEQLEAKWEEAKSLTLEKVKELEKNHPTKVISTSGLTIEEAQLRIAQRHADLCDQHMLWAPQFIKHTSIQDGCEQRTLACGYKYCPAFLSIDSMITEMEIAKVADKRTTSIAELLLSIWALQNDKSATPTPKGEWKLENISVSVFGKFQEVFRKALGLDADPPTTSTSSKRNGAGHAKTGLKRNLADLSVF